MLLQQQPLCELVFSTSQASDAFVGTTANPCSLHRRSSLFPAYHMDCAPINGQEEVNDPGG
jgi:hypothetical protein